MPVDHRRPAPRFAQRYGVPLALLALGAVSWWRGAPLPGVIPAVSLQVKLPSLAPRGVAVDRAGALYITGWGGPWRVGRLGQVRDMTGGLVTGLPSRVGSVRPNTPDVAVDAKGAVYVAHSELGVWRLDPQAKVPLVLGMGLPGPAGYRMKMPSGIDVGRDGSVYIADSGECLVWKADPRGSLSIIAGGSARGYSGDGVPAREAGLAFPVDVAVGSGGDVFIAESEGGRVRRVDSAGRIHTLVDGGTLDGPPLGILYDGGGLYVAAGHRVYRVEPSGNIATMAGTGKPGAGGDGGPAVRAELSGPRGLAMDAAGNLFVADSGNGRVRRIDRRGIITTVVTP